MVGFEGVVVGLAGESPTARVTGVLYGRNDCEDGPVLSRDEATTSSDGRYSLGMPILGSEAVCARMTAVATGPDGEALVGSVMRTGLRRDAELESSGTVRMSPITLRVVIERPSVRAREYGDVALVADTVDAPEAELAAARSNRSPRAAMAATPSIILLGDAFEYSGAGSSDPDGHAISYAWAFGDYAAAGQEEGSHVYRSAGTYVVRLAVTDPFGAVDVAATTITVVRRE